MLMTEKSIEGVYSALFRKTAYFYHGLGLPYKAFVEDLQNTKDPIEAIQKLAGYTEEIAKIGYSLGVEESVKRMEKVIRG